MEGLHESRANVLCEIHDEYCDLCQSIDAILICGEDRERSLPILMSEDEEKRPGSATRFV